MINTFIGIVLGFGWQVGLAQIAQLQLVSS